MSDRQVLYLSRKDVEDIDLSMSEIIETLEGVFREKGEGKTEMPPKPGIHPRPDAFIHAMPAYVRGLEAAGMKWVSGFPENEKRGLPYISGLLILNDAENGLPIAVMDCTWITAMRTGAATAVAARYLARKESSVAGIVACGVQGRSNLEALSCVFNLERVKAFDIVTDVAQRYAVDMSRKLQIEIEVVNSAEAAVKDVDLVVTSGPILKRPRPVIPDGWLSQGAFACALDFDSYWQGSALEEADKLATDDLEQLSYYRRNEGYFQDTPEPYADLGEISSGKKPGRQSQTERIISLHLGLAIEDVATAQLLYRRAVGQGIGVRLPL